MRTPLLLLLCSTFAIACSPSAVNDTPLRFDGAVTTDAPPGIDRPVSPDGTVAPDVVVTPDDAVAPADTVGNPDVPADVPIMPTTCRSSRDCARGVCDRVRSVCVECVTAAQCSGSTPVCLANRCAPAVACMSSRMCPGQVCDTSRAVCVDCVSDPDCMGGNVCVRNSCLPAPLPCRSSRECATLDQVCDASRAACVDCVSDVDCPAAQLCTPERMCAPQVCTPGARECLELRRIRTCNTNGSGWVESSCGSGASCVNHRCQAQVCSPGSASCGSMTQRRVCNPDGLGYTPTECAAMESCSLGACRPSWVCTPGAYSCASTAERRVCNADGLGYAPAACPLPPNATATACTTGTCSFTCAAGFANCDGSTSNGCEVGLQTSTSHCGMCGRACPGAGSPGTSVTCTAGTRGSACLTGYADCDGSAANGCEANLGANSNHCGACGMVCPSGQSCVARVCTAAPPDSLNTGRYGFGAAAAPDGRVYVFGGYNLGYLNSVEMFDPATNRWTGRAPLPNSPWALTGAALTDGRILSISGYGGSTYSTAVYAYNPVSNAWTAIRAPVTARVGANAVTAPDGRVFLFGGGTDTTGATATLSVEIYDPVANTWSAGPALTTSRTYAGAVLGTDGRIYIAGGFTGSNYQATATAFAPVAGTYTAIAGLNVSHGYVRLAPLLDGRILAIAGSNTTSTYLVRVEAYSPAANLWR